MELYCATLLQACCLDHPNGMQKSKLPVASFTSRSKSTFPDSVQSSRIHIKTQLQILVTNPRFKMYFQPDPGRRSKKQSQVWWWVMGRLPWGGKSRKSCKIQFKIQVGVSRGNFKFHDFKLQFPSFKFQTKNQVRASSFIFKFQVSNQDTGQGFKLQFPIVKIQTKIQVRVSRCHFQVSIVKPRSRSGFRVAISKFQVSNQDPGRGFKIQFFMFGLRVHGWTRLQTQCP